MTQNIFKMFLLHRKRPAPGLVVRLTTDHEVPGSIPGEDSHADHGLDSLVEFRLRPLLALHIHVTSSTSSRQRNCASWAPHPQKSVTRRPQLGGETAKSIRDMWCWGMSLRYKNKPTNTVYEMIAVYSNSYKTNKYVV
jgi:hypothetical protein